MLICLIIFLFIVLFYIMKVVNILNYFEKRVLFRLVYVNGKFDVKFICNILIIYLDFF